MCMCVCVCVCVLYRDIKICVSFYVFPVYFQIGVLYYNIHIHMHVCVCVCVCVYMCVCYRDMCIKQNVSVGFDIVYATVI